MRLNIAADENIGYVWSHVKMNTYNKHKFRISITYFDTVFHCLRYDWCSLNHIISSSAVVYWHLTGKLTPPTVYVEPTPNIHFYSNGWKHTFICIFFFCQFSGNFVKIFTSIFATS